MTFCYIHNGDASTQDYVEIDNYKYTKKALCTELVLFTRLYRGSQSTKHKIQQNIKYSLPYENWKQATLAQKQRMIRDINIFKTDFAHFAPTRTKPHAANLR